MRGRRGAGEVGRGGQKEKNESRKGATGEGGRRGAGGGQWRWRMGVGGRKASFA